MRISSSVRKTGIFFLVIGRLIRTLFLRPPAYTKPNAIPRRRRSIAIRVVDCGSNNGVEQEIQAMFNPIYDAERYGLRLVTSPRHADVLLVTGPLTRNMERPLLAAFRAMPEPRRVVTVGDDVEGGGVYTGSYAIIPLPKEILAARAAHVPGDPPAPDQILQKLLEVDFWAKSN